MKKILSILLLIAMLAIAFTSCVATPSTEPEKSSSQSSTNNDSTNTDTSDRDSSNANTDTNTNTNNEEALSSLKCKNELTAVLEKSKSQKNVRFEEDGWVYAYYFDGTDSFVYMSGGKDGKWNEEWLGKVDNEYLYFCKHTEAQNTTKSYEVSSKEAIDNKINYITGNIFENYFEYCVISAIEEATIFECLKTTSDKTVYQIKAGNSNSTQNITVSVVDGLVTEISIKDYITVNYNYNSKITMPNKNEYTQSQDLSLNQTKNELNAVLEKSKAQKTARFEEDGWVYAYYFDGNDSFVYMSGGKEGKWNEEWLGKVGNEYLYFNKRTTAQGTTKIYEVSSKSEIDEYIANINEDIFQYLEYTLIDFIKDSTSFNCKKNFGANTVYQISSTDKYCTREFTVTVVDGIVTEMIIYEDGEHYVTVTYDYTSTIAMPNKNEYSPN